MADAVTEILPATNGQIEVTITADYRPRFTPRELETIKAETGRSLMQLISDDESDEKFRVLAWLKLRRSSHPLEWDEMRDVIIGLDEKAEPVDPLNEPPSSGSPPSVSSGE